MLAQLLPTTVLPPSPVFPVVHHPLAAQVLDIARQLRRFEQLPPAQQQALQADQILALLRHAHACSPFWRARLDAAGFNPAAATFDGFGTLPVLSRSELQNHFAAMRARLPGQDDSAFVVAATSGSTGQPVLVERLRELHGLLYEAVGLIDNEWHGRDPSQTLGVLGIGLQDAAFPDWGGIYPLLGYRGQGFSRGLATHPLASHLAWLAACRPGYLKCSPLAAAELARLALASGQQLPLRQILSQSERVLPAHRALCRAAFGAEIKDRYSCEEAGWLALQCPQHDHLHILSGTVHVEIVDEAGQACPVGQPGRVLVTGLHSYAMPLIRYELGDLAEWGPPCDCGITLPVIRRLWGRTRHQLRLPSGERRPMPALGDDIGRIAAVQEFQVRQYLGGELEILCRVSRPLCSAERDAIARILRTDVTAELQVFIREVDAIDWGPGWKRDEFVSLEAPRPTGAG